MSSAEGRSAGNIIKPLIDGTAYFKELESALSQIGTSADRQVNQGQFLYIAGWWLHLMGGEVRPAPGSGASTGFDLHAFDPFMIDGVDGSRKLLDLLKQKAQAGVDVRVLGWISWSVMTSSIAMSGAVSIRDVNIGTLATVHELRGNPATAKGACLNILAHTAGAAHMKMVLVGLNPVEAVGFTGGIDFVTNRHDSPEHKTWKMGWHDVQARVDGPVVQAMYDLFRDLWNENRTREPIEFKYGAHVVPSVLPDTPPVPARAVNPFPLGRHQVQSLRTIPRFNYTTFNMLPENKPIAFAPEGLFELRNAWQRAISQAQRYIYMEDQAFWSVEVMQWINQALRAHADLKVILVHGVKDPSDPQLPPFFQVALFDGLLPGLSAQERARIGVYARARVVVHSKTTLIDDAWAIIGSANCMRRSLYTDIEHSVAFTDEEGKLVRAYRIQLWGEHFGLTSPEQRDQIADLDSALHVWNAAWGKAGSLTLPPTMLASSLPTARPAISDSDQEKYDRYLDPDSRDAWGGCLP